MSARRHLAALVRSQLTDEMRAGEVALVVLPFGVIALLVIPMAVGVDTPLLERIGPGLYWAIVLLFGVIVTQRHSAQMPAAVHDMLVLSGVDPAVRMGATALTSFVLLLGFEIGSGLATVVLYAPRLGSWWWLAAILPLTAAGIALIGTLAGTIVGGVSTRTTLAPLIVVPVAVPLLLGAAQATEGLRVGAGILRWILLLAVVDVVLAIAAVVSARPLEDATS